MKKAVSVITKLNALLALLFVGMASVTALAWRMLPEADRDLFLAGAAGLTAALMLAGLVLRLSIRAGILRSIRAAAHVIGRVAEGDLTARVGIQAHGETQKMLRGLEQMTAEGTEFRTGVNVGVDVTVEQLREDFDAVVLANGATVWRDLPIPGRELDGI